MPNTDGIINKLVTLFAGAYCFLKGTGNLIGKLTAPLQAIKFQPGDSELPSKNIVTLNA